MAIRVAHIGTGNVGRLALTGLLTNPQLELTGLCVSSEDKVGRDAGELAGLDVSTGIVATNDLDAVLAGEPECVVYCAMGDDGRPRRWRMFDEFWRPASTSSVPLPWCCNSRGG